jgi:hypothetical protein
MGSGKSKARVVSNRRLLCTVVGWLGPSSTLAAGPALRFVEVPALCFTEVPALQFAEVSVLRFAEVLLSFAEGLGPLPFGLEVRLPIASEECWDLYCKSCLI